jgi:hypothetical protein
MSNKWFNDLGGRNRRSVTLAILGLLMTCCSSAHATTKGLNQIVTPDIQPSGQLSISYQEQDPNIGNPTEFQLELGLNKQCEIALFQGFNPHEQIVSTEFGLVQKGNYLLSTGFSNWTTKGSDPQAYLEAGYYKGPLQTMIGAGQAGKQTQLILGWADQVSPKIKLQVDYQAGDGNSTTAGFTVSVTPQLQFNPAVYVSNASSHAVYGYAVLTWNVQLFK